LANKVGRFNANSDRANLNCNRNPSNQNDNLGIVFFRTFLIKMKTYNNLYENICSKKNLVLAWKKARKGKTKKEYVIEFEEDIVGNINSLYEELKNQIYFPRPLETFVIRDPKTRKISRADFRDRIIHHAICNIIEPIFERIFIYDNCANRKNKGSLFALKRFKKFQRKVTNNLSKQAFCLKADIKQYFREIDRRILIEILKKKIKCRKTISLIEIILNNSQENKGMPLGNLTSQFFANVYLNELDYFVKHELKAKFYVRYVDDFVILHSSKKRLEDWKNQIKDFLRGNLKLELHPDKSKIISLSKGVDFVGFRNFYYCRLLRKRNIRSMKKKVELFSKGEFTQEKFKEILQGWCAHAKWANTYNLRRRIINEIINL